MRDQVQEVKDKTDIVNLISGFIEVKKAGANYKAVCPFHSEKLPSFNVSPQLQIYKCFGCGKSGDVFTFLEDYEGMEFYEALKFLAEKAGVKLVSTYSENKGHKHRLYEINEYILKFYRYVLLKHPAGKNALKYLTEERGIAVGTIDTFKIGYSPDQSLALQNYLMGKKKVSMTELVQTGVVYQGGGKSVDRFRGRIIFPLYDSKDNLVGFAGRVIPGPQTDKYAKYINTPETEIYHKSKILYGLNLTKAEIKKKNEAIIVEGEIDLVSSWQAGFKNLVAIKGSALTEDQIKLLARYCKRITLALDTDFAGNEAAIRGIHLLENEGFDIKVAKIKGFKDPDEVARKNPELLNKFLQEAQNVWDFIIDFVFDKYKNEKGGGKTAKVSRELTPILAAIENKIVQGHYISLVAKKLGVQEEAVMAEVVKTPRGKGSSSSISVKLSDYIEPETKSRYQMLEERLLAIIFKYHPKLLHQKKYAKHLSSSFSMNILSQYLEFVRNNEDFDLSRFTREVPKELFDKFVDLVIKDIKGLENPTDAAYEKELGLVVDALKILKLKNRLEKVAKNIKEYEDAGLSKKLALTEKRFTFLSKKLSELEAGKLKGIIL